MLVDSDKAYNRNNTYLIPKNAYEKAYCSGVPPVGLDETVSLMRGLEAVTRAADRW
jgi:hypothetical protein